MLLVPCWLSQGEEGFKVMVTRYVVVIVVVTM